MASGRKYDPGKKAPLKRTASGDIPTPTKKPTQEKKQQPTQSDTITETTDSQTPGASQMSEPEDDDDESLLDPLAPSKTFSTKDPKATLQPCRGPQL